MTLRWKALLLILTGFVALVATLLLVQHTIMLPAFARLELESAEADLMRARHALDSDGKFLSAMAGDYGAWDDTYDFIADHNARYVRTNLVPETFHNLHVDAVLMLDTAGRTVWGGIAAGGDSISPLPQSIANAVRATPLFTNRGDANASASGIVQTELGLTLAGSAAITTSDRTAAPRGAIVMLRVINAGTSRELADRTRVDLHLTPAGVAGGLDAAPLTTLPGGSWLACTDPDTLRICTTVQGVNAKPALVMRADVPRRIVGRARAAASLSLWTALCAGALLLVVLWVGITRTIVNPLARVTRHALRVGSEDDLTARLGMTSNDEIGILARAFDHMVDQVADSRRRLLDVAHDAGRSEIATSVLHNVGNSLNSVNVAVSLISNQVEHSEVTTVAQLAALLREHQDDLPRFLSEDPRGKTVPRFVDDLAGRLAREQHLLRGEVRALSEAVQHIRFVVDAQQEHVVTAPILEPATASALVNEALALAASPSEWGGLRVVRPRGDDPVTRIDRRRVLQILTNLLANARQAVLAGHTPAPQIVIETDVTTIEGQDYVRFRVGDNGVGIPAANLERIFGFGFTTRGDGHGIGLHAAANLAREIGGSLRAESGGPGLGAVFTLLVPVAMEEVPA